MATKARLNAVVSRLFGLFLFVVAAGNVLVGTREFAILFGVVGLVFVSLSGYVSSNPEEFGGDASVPDRAVRAVVLGGWAVIAAAVVVVGALAAM